VYALACLAVVADPATREQRHFARHTAPIVAMALHPARVLVATADNGAVPAVLPPRPLPPVQSGHVSSIPPY